MWWYDALCLQEEEEEQLEEDDSVKEETAEQEIPNWTWTRGRKHTLLLCGSASSLSISVQTIAHVTFY